MSFKAAVRPPGSLRVVGLGDVCVCVYECLCVSVARERGFLLSIHHFLIKVKFP